MTDHFPGTKKMVPERIVLSADAFDALQRRSDQLDRYDPRVAKVLSTPAPWSESCDKTSTSADQ